MQNTCLVSSEKMVVSAFKTCLLLYLALIGLRWIACSWRDGKRRGEENSTVFSAEKQFKWQKRFLYIDILQAHSSRFNVITYTSGPKK